LPQHTHERERIHASTMPLSVDCRSRDHLEATFTNLSIPELPVNRSAQLFYSAPNLSTRSDRNALDAEPLNVQLADGDSGSTASTRACFRDKHAEAQPLNLKDPIEPCRWNPEPGCFCFPSVVRCPSSEGDSRITQPRGQGRSYFLNSMLPNPLRFNFLHLSSV
jgi:hypothetical protein